MKIRDQQSKSDVDRQITLLQKGVIRTFKNNKVWHDKPRRKQEREVFEELKSLLIDSELVCLKRSLMIYDLRQREFVPH